MGQCKNVVVKIRKGILKSFSFDDNLVEGVVVALSEGCGIVAPTEPPPNHFLHEIIDNQIFKCFYNLTFQPVFASDPILGIDIRYHSMLSATTPSMMRLSSERLDFYIVSYPPLVNSIEVPNNRLIINEISLLNIS